MHIYISAKAISFLRVASIGIAAYEWVFFDFCLFGEKADILHYSYLLTVPAEWRFYASQRRPRRFTYVAFFSDEWSHLIPSISAGSLSCCLFALIRWVMRVIVKCRGMYWHHSYDSYLSIALVVVSNVGWFSTFSVETCRQWYLVPPIFKGAVSEGLRYIL